MSYTNRPEDKYHGRKQYSPINQIAGYKIHNKVGQRFKTFVTQKLLEDTHLNKFLYKHS